MKRTLKKRTNEHNDERTITEKKILFSFDSWRVEYHNIHIILKLFFIPILNNQNNYIRDIKNNCLHS